jgi:DNA-binding MarR family transcriptional regulator
MQRMSRADATNLEPIPPEHVQAGDLTFGSLPHTFGFKLRRVQLAYKKHFARLAAGTGFQLNQVGAMSLIARNPGVTPGALAAALTIDAAQVTSIVKELELRGFISRRKSPTDSRSRSLRLTAIGKRQFEQLKIIIAEVETSFIGASLSAEECEQLSALLERVRAEPNNRGG